MRSIAPACIGFEVADAGSEIKQQLAARKFGQLAKPVRIVGNDRRYMQSEKIAVKVVERLRRVHCLKRRSDRS